MLLGIDVGTTKCAAVIVSLQGKVVADYSVIHRASVSVAERRSEQDSRRLLSAAFEAVCRLPEDLRRQIESVGVTGQMHGVVVLDGKGTALGNLVNWQDGRCLENQNFLGDLKTKTGYKLETGFGCATLGWLCNRGELPPETSVACTIHDLLAMQLIGAVKPLIDTTNAASWGLFDLDKLIWDRAAIEKAGVPFSIMPKVVPCGSTVGSLCADAASKLSLPEGIPVAAAIGDNQASLLATLSRPQSQIALTLGTGGQLSVIVGKRELTETLLNTTFEFRPYVDGCYAVVAASLCGGSAWAWLAESASVWTEQLGVGDLELGSIYEKLNTLGLAEKDGPVIRPHFIGERSDYSLRGVIEGITRHNFGLGQLARGLAFGIMENLSSMMPASFLEERRELLGSGNALRRNELLRHAAATVFGLPLTMLQNGEEAAVGAALLAKRQL